MYVEYQFISKLANSENIVYGIPLYNVPIFFYLLATVSWDL
jgi:hypothetical protein